MTFIRPSQHPVGCAPEARRLCGGEVGSSQAAGLEPQGETKGET